MLSSQSSLCCTCTAGTGLALVPLDPAAGRKTSSWASFLGKIGTKRAGFSHPGTGGTTSAVFPTDLHASIQHPKAEQTLRPHLEPEPCPRARRWQEKTALDHPCCFWHGEAENICPSWNAKNTCTMSSVVFTALSGDEHQHPWGWGRGRRDADITSPGAPGVMLTQHGGATSFSQFFRLLQEKNPC